jgi:predicted component of type VI protein secretion system
VALSGLLLERAGAPTLLRAFSAADTVTANVQVRRVAGTTAAISLTSRVVDSQDRTMLESVTTLDEAAFAGSRVADVRIALPLADLGPGEYLLTMSGTGGPDAQRLRFRIR